MTATVSLREIVGELSTLTDGFPVYLNRKSGEIVGLPEEDLQFAGSEEDLNRYPAWEQELIRQGKEITSSEDYIPLPSKFDIHEYNIMRRFCSSLENERLSSELLDAIGGRGAFRRFESLIKRHNIQEEWYQYLEQALTEIAVEWLEENKIPYE